MAQMGSVSPMAAAVPSGAPISDPGASPGSESDVGLSACVQRKDDRIDTRPRNQGRHINADGIPPANDPAVAPDLPDRGGGRFRRQLNERLHVGITDDAVSLLNGLSLPDDQVWRFRPGARADGAADLQKTSDNRLGPGSAGKHGDQQHRQQDTGWRGQNGHAQRGAGFGPGPYPARRQSVQLPPGQGGLRHHRVEAKFRLESRLEPWILLDGPPNATIPSSWMCPGGQQGFRLSLRQGSYPGSRPCPMEQAAHHRNQGRRFTDSGIG
jgi:hypothetical protein